METWETASIGAPGFYKLCLSGPPCLVKLFLFLPLARGIIIKALSITKGWGKDQRLKCCRLKLELLLSVWVSCKYCMYSTAVEATSTSSVNAGEAVAHRPLILTITPDNVWFCRFSFVFEMTLATVVITLRLLFRAFGFRS